MKHLKSIAAMAVLALSSLAFGQTAPAAGSSAPPAAASAATDPSDPTTANANVDCKLEDGSKKTVTAKAAGKNAVAIAKCGEDPKPVVRRPAAPPTNTATNAETVKRLAEELAGLRAKAAECASGSRHIFQRPDGGVTLVCKGENDEVHPAPVVAPRVINPAIIHGAQGRVSAPAVAAPSGGAATGSRFLAFCEAKFNNGVAQDHVPANSDSAADIRAACDAWAKAQAEKRGITRAASVNNNHGASIFAPAK